MTEPKNTGDGQPNKRILERPFYAGLVVPIAIVLTGALIILGVTKMLSTSKSHRDLVQELQSKRFGNRWVAAYELSKVLNTKKFEGAEAVWITNALIDVYKGARDARTRNFLVLAVGSMQGPQAIEFLVKAARDPDNKVVFSALASIGNHESIEGVDLTLLKPLFDSEDPGLVQALQFALAQHKIDWAKDLITKNLNAESLGLRYASAVALINYKEDRAIDTLAEILSLADTVKERGPNVLDAKKRLALKVNILNLIGKQKWDILRPKLVQLASDGNITVSTKAKEVLNILKN